MITAIALFAWWPESAPPLDDLREDSSTARAQHREAAGPTDLSVAPSSQQPDRPDRSSASASLVVEVVGSVGAGVGEEARPLAAVSVVLERLEPSSIEVLERRLSNNDGRTRFHFAKPTENAAYLVSVNAEAAHGRDAHTQFLSWPQPNVQPGSDFVLRVALERASSNLEVSVVDPEGLAVPGARVIVRAARVASNPAPGAARAFAAVPACSRQDGLLYRIRDAASCRACHSEPGRPAKRDEPPEDELLEAQYDRSSEALRPIDSLATATCDDSGCVRIENLVPGKYRVRAIFEDADLRAEQGLAPAAEVHLRAHQTTAVELVVLRPIVFRATLDTKDIHSTKLRLDPRTADAETRGRYLGWSGLGEAAVDELFALQRPLVFELRIADAWSDEKGIEAGIWSLDFGDVIARPGPYWLHTEVHALSDMTPLPPQRLDLGPDVPRTWHEGLDLSPHVMSGRFVDANGAGLSSVRVVARTPDGFLIKHSESDEDGRYELRGMPAGPILLTWDLSFDPAMRPAIHVMPTTLVNVARYSGPRTNVVQRIAARPANKAQKPGSEPAGVNAPERAASRRPR